MAAFTHSYALGFRRLEADIRTTADGVAVLHHDASVRRTFGVRQRIGNTTWEQLRVLRRPDGQRLIRPFDVLAAFSDAEFVADIKDEGALDALLRDVWAAGAWDRICLTGEAAGAEFSGSGVPGVGAELGWRTRDGLWAWLRSTSPWSPQTRPRLAHVPDRRLGTGLLSPGVIDASANVRIVAWTVDDPVRMHQLLDRRIAGIVTARPDLLKQVLLERGTWVEPPHYVPPPIGQRESSP